MSDINNAKEVLTPAQPLPGFNHEGDIFFPAKYGTMLAFKSNDAAHLYDVSSEPWQLVTTIKTEYSIDGIKLYDDKLVLWGSAERKNSGISIHNIADGALLFECSHPYENVGLDLKENDIFIAHDEGLTHLDITNSVFTDAGFVPHPKHPDIPHGMYASYDKGVLVSKKYVYISGRHVGVNVFRREEGNQLTFIKSVGLRYTPTAIQWLKEEESLLLLGDAHVLVIDVTKPEKPKKLPTVSFKKSEVECGVWDGETFLALVRPISQDKKMKLASINLTLTPTLLNEYTFAREDGATPKAAILNGKRLTILYRENISVFEYAGFPADSSDKFLKMLQELRGGEFAKLISPVLDSLQALDKKALIKKVAAELEKSFKDWNEQIPEESLEKANFEWPGQAASPADYQAVGYGTSKESHQVDFTEGFDAGFAYSLIDNFILDSGKDSDDETLVEAVEDLRALADDFTCSVVTEAFTIAVKSDSFKKLNKGEALSFTMNSHDDSPVEIYSCDSSK